MKLKTLGGKKKTMNVDDLDVDLISRIGEFAKKTDFTKFVPPPIPPMPSMNSMMNLEQVKVESVNVPVKKILENSVRQIDLMQSQNDNLTHNYNKLSELYDIQKKDYDETKAELKKSKRINTIMMIIAVIAMLAAIASPIVTLVVSR